MNKPATETALYCASGIVQYSNSAEDLLDEYNRNGSLYEIRTDADGRQTLWHKGQRRTIGTFAVIPRRGG